MVNLCRDEVTHTLKHKIDQVYGSSFSTHGLGGMLTLGVTGVGAGLSHSPVCQVGGLILFLATSRNMLLYKAQ